MSKKITVPVEIDVPDGYEFEEMLTNGSFAVEPQVALVLDSAKALE